MRNRLSIFLLAAALQFLSAPTDAAQSFITKGELGEILGYPGERLTVEDLTDKGKEKHGDGIIAVHKYSASDQTFAPITIVLARSGMLLTPELEKEIEAEIQTQEPSQVPVAQLQSIVIDDNTSGYTGLVVVGPGGSQQRTIFTLRKQSVDVQITIAIPGEDLLDLLEGAESYRKGITDGGIGSRLLECAKLVVENVKEANSADLATALPPVLEQAQRPLSVSDANSNGESVEEESPIRAEAQQSGSHSQSPKWPYAIIILSLVGIVVLVIRSRKGKPRR